jgi:hypothetical protein
MDRRFLKPFAARVLLGVLILFPAATVKDFCISKWPNYERPIEVVIAVLVAVLLYLLVFGPILGYVDQSKGKSAGDA